jgi:hypothetical protein
MATLHGTVRQRDGAWWIEYSYPAYDYPKLFTVAWKVTQARKVAPYGPAPDLADGLAVTLEGVTHDWTAYDHGNYLVLTTHGAEGIVAESELPAPKVRKGTEVRYYCGAWQKYRAREGWVTA